jgi:hypothetical protein
MHVMAKKKEEKKKEKKEGPCILLTMNYSVRVCRNFTISNEPSMSLPHVSCAFSIPTLLAPSHDLSEILPFPLSICASGIAANIKQVTFQYNSSGNASELSSLGVKAVEDKRYPSDSLKPLWAVESPIGNWTVSEIALLWGIVDGESSVPGVQTLRNSTFYLPATTKYQIDSALGELGDTVVSNFL